LDHTSYLPYLAVLPYLLPLAALVLLAKKKPGLKEFPPRLGRRLSVIIPARNEEGTIENCVRSILRSTYAPLEIIVVDDRSTDATAEIVERLAAEDGRVRLLRGAALPEGWYGKPWACVQGYRAATGEVLCFTDADTTHEPALLAHSVGALEATGAGLFTVMPAQLCLTWAERTVLPQIFFLLFVRFRPEMLNRATDPKDAIANGQFIMMTREGYEATGTHEVVKHEVAEDLALAQEVLKRGKRIQMAYALDLMQTRMYTGWAHIREGWSKNLHLGARRVFPPEQKFLRAVAPNFVAVPFLFWLVPFAVLTLELAGVSTGFAGPATSAIILCTLFWVLFDLGMGIPAQWGLAWPFGSAAAAYIALRSSIRGARRVEWKGRTYGEGSTTTNA
jgi:chlorobactene glucosyltransferase